MTEITTPFDAVLEMQRNTIKQSQDFLQQSLELQQNMFEAFMHSGISAQRSAQHQGVDFLKQLFDAQLDIFESALDNEALRESFNSQLEEFEATQQRAWDEFESELGDGFQDMTDQQKRLVARTVDAALTAQRTAQEDTVEPVRASEASPENVSEAVETVAETAQQQMAKDVRTTGDGMGDQGEKLETIEGLGETYADRLRSSGIQSIEHLADADTTTIAEAAEVNEDNAEEWISSARSQT